jgi:hypothetical protein
LIPEGELVTTPPPAFEMVNVLFKFENEKLRSDGATVVWYPNVVPVFTNTPEL